MTNTANRQHLLTFKEIYSDEDFPLFDSDKKRIQYMKSAYKNMSLSQAMSIYYGEKVSQQVRQNKSINNVLKIELGQIICGTVKEFTRTHILFDVPGIKEEIICKENFTNCEDHVQSYLLSHDNKLLFEVREKKNNTYYVSVISAYYKAWIDNINNAIDHEYALQVHIDDLVQGGYICHTPIVTLNDLTGRNYTHSVFIPGSHIVLNIEHDFNKWIGEDVIIVPQKIVEYHKNFKTGEIENSLVGSRKRVLQILGMKNMYDLYQRFVLSQNENVSYVPPKFEGVVTGIINSQKKTGVFIEIPDQYITGMLPVDSIDLLNYRPGDHIEVIIDNFEKPDDKEAFILNKRGNILKSNVRIVFRIA